MEVWLIWVLIGIVLSILETVVPGGIVIFLGFSALAIGGAIYIGWITSLKMAIIGWFILSIFSMLFLRSVFIKYFEGDATIDDVDEDVDYGGSIVEVVEDIHPYQDGRVKYRGTTWGARSDDEISKGESAIIVKKEDNILIVTTLKS